MQGRRGETYCEIVSKCHTTNGVSVLKLTEALFFLHKRSSNQRKRSKVDAPIEDHVDPLICDGGINDSAFSRLLSLDGHCATLILVGDQGCDIGLDAAGTEANDNDGSDVATESMSTCD